MWRTTRSHTCAALVRARPGGEEPTPHTPFIIGSLTKSFTALAVMQLVEDGKVELDAPVQRYLPWFRVADPLCIRPDHRAPPAEPASGLPQLSGLRPMTDFDDSPGATERQARALSTLVLARPVGSAWEYCNMNYNLLGLIIEAASGESYEVYVQNHIFTPLQMTHTYSSRPRPNRTAWRSATDTGLPSRLPCRRCPSRVVRFQAVNSSPAPKI